MTQLAEAIANAANNVAPDMLSATFTVASIRTMNISGCTSPYEASDIPASRRLRRLTEYPTVDFALLAASAADAEAFMSLEVPATFAQNINTSFFASSGIALSQVSAGAFAPGCTAPTTARAMDPPCQEGTLLRSGDTCTTQCEGSGYQPSVPTLTCNAGDIGSFQCTGRQCHAPAHPETDTLFTSCLIGESILDGEMCVPACPEGQIPDVPSLACSAGVLNPLNFSCISPDCQSPTGISFAGVPACNGLVNVTPGGNCTPVCAPGYHPSVPSLICGLDGWFVNNASFVCEPDATSPTTPMPYVEVPSNASRASISPLSLDTPLRSAFVVWGAALLGTGAAAFLVLRRAAGGASTSAVAATDELHTPREVEALVSGS